MKLTDIINSILYIYQLEQTPRSGYEKRGIPFNQKDCESVTEHIGTGAILSYLLALEYAPALDAKRVPLLLLFHDVPEAITKDRTPGEITPDQKKESEALAYAKIIAPFSRLGKEKLSLLHEEYLANQTPEAQFAHDIDVLQRCIRAGIYFKEHPELNILQEFFPETALIKNHKLQEICINALTQITH